jgi:DNA-binding CsgD family transcriptional regulator
VLGCRAARLGDPAQALRLLTVARGMRAASGVTRHGYLDRAVSHADSQSRQLLGTARAAQIVAAAEPLTVNDVLGQPPAEPAGPTAALAARERQVAGLAAAGMTNRQIGRRLGISERTAERHMENLRAKLGARSRAQVAA